MPRFYRSPSGTELPSAWLSQRGLIDNDDDPNILARLREGAVEVYPGVFVSVLSFGRMVLPGGEIDHGATIAVWTESKSPWIPADPDGLPPITYPAWRRQELLRREEETEMSDG